MAKINIAVLGAGNMGTAVAQVIAGNGNKVKIWNYEGDPLPLEQINKYHQNRKYLPKVNLAKNLVAEPDLGKAVAKAEIVFLAVPSFCVAQTTQNLNKHLPKNTIIVDVSKGFDERTMNIVPNTIKKNLKRAKKKNIASISGPAIATDMVKGGYTAMNVAASSEKIANKIKKVMENKHLKLVFTNDMVGLEIVGSFKNVYAISLGICDGLKMQMNSKSILLVAAMKELANLSKKLGGKRGTCYDLAGLGDLVGTSMSQKSRNRRFGEYIASGMSYEKSLKKVGQVVEGIGAVKLLIKLARKNKLKMPLAEMVYKVVHQKKSASKELDNFFNK